MSNTIKKMVEEIFSKKAAEQINGFMEFIMFRPGMAITSVWHEPMKSEQSRKTITALKFNLAVAGTDDQTPNSDIEVKIYGQKTDSRGRGDSPLVSWSKGTAGYGFRDNAGGSEFNVMIDAMLADQAKVEMAEKVEFKNLAELDTSAVSVNLPANFDWDTAKEVESNLACMLLMNEMIPGCFTDFILEKETNGILIRATTSIGGRKVVGVSCNENDPRDLQFHVGTAFFNALMKATSEDVTSETFPKNGMTRTFESQYLNEIVEGINAFIKKNLEKHVGNIFEDPRYPGQYRWVIMEGGSCILGEKTYSTKSDAEKRMRAEFRNIDTFPYCFFVTTQEGIPDSGILTQALLSEKPEAMAMFEKIGNDIIEESEKRPYSRHPMMAGQLVAEDQWRLNIRAGIVAAKRLMMSSEFGKGFGPHKIGW